MRNSLRVVLFLAASVGITSQVAAQQAVGSSTVIINFTGFTGTGLTPTPAAGQLSSGVWAVAGFSDGPLAFGGTATTGDLARGASTGDIDVSGLYAFSSGGDVFLGIQSSGTDFTPGTLTARFSNALTGTMASVDVSYRIMTLNDQSRSSAVTFSYSTDGTTFTPVGGLDYASPTTANTAGWGLTDRSTNVSLGIASAALFYLRWSIDDISGAGPRDELGIDDIILLGHQAAQTPVCGNGAVEGTEECDDANAVNTDACLDTCEDASCGDGEVQDGVEDCDDANADNTDACLDTCEDASCGDGEVQGGVEECDDANAVNTDACLDTCENAGCGDGFVQTGVEECEGGQCCNTSCQYRVAGFVCTGGACDGMGVCVADEPMGGGGEGGETSGGGGQGGEVPVGGEGGTMAGTAGSGMTAGSAGTAGSDTAGSAGTGGSAGSAGSAGAGPTGGAGSAGGPTTAGSAGTAPGTGGAAGAAGAAGSGGAPRRPPAVKDEGGCGCRVPGDSRGENGALALLGLAVAAAVGRRRTRR